MLLYVCIIQTISSKAQVTARNNVSITIRAQMDKSWMRLKASIEYIHKVDGFLDYAFIKAS